MLAQLVGEQFPLVLTLAGDSFRWSLFLATASAAGEPAWHRRARRQRQSDRILLRLGAAVARLAQHHGSEVPKKKRGYGTQRPVFAQLSA